MYITVYLLLLAPALLSALAPALARRLAPPTTVRVLTALAALAAGASVWGLAVLALGGLARTGEVQDYVRSDPAALAATDPVPRSLGAIALLLLTVAAFRLVLTAQRQRRDLRALAPLRALPAADELIVLDDDVPDAYALPGRPARIVVTSGMLRALPTAERRAMLAHERAHLAHRHHRYAMTTKLTAALNPLLSRMADVVSYQLERWADEEAATQTGSRTLTARSLARAALATSTAHRLGPGPALAYLRHQVPERIAALQLEQPANRWSAAWPTLTAAALTALALADTISALNRFLQILHP